MQILQTGNIFQDTKMEDLQLTEILTLKDLIIDTT